MAARSMWDEALLAMGEADRERVAERAAILEFEAAMPRLDAECAALAEVILRGGSEGKTAKSGAIANQACPAIASKRPQETRSPAVCYLGSATSAASILEPLRAADGGGR